MEALDLIREIQDVSNKMNIDAEQKLAIIDDLIDDYLLQAKDEDEV